MASDTPKIDAETYEAMLWRLTERYHKNFHRMGLNTYVLAEFVRKYDLDYAKTYTDALHVKRCWLEKQGGTRPLPQEQANGI